MDSFPERLRKARKDKGLSQNELAVLVGVTSQSISKMELGKMGVGSATLLRLSKTLGVPPAELHPEPIEADTADAEVDEEAGDVRAQAVLDLAMDPSLGVTRPEIEALRAAASQIASKDGRAGVVRLLRTWLIGLRSERGASTAAAPDQSPSPSELARKGIVTQKAKPKKRSH